MDGTIPFTEFAAPLMTLAAETNVSAAFDQFQTEAQELALVLRDGKVIDHFTATDALEAVMGELKVPLDQRVST